MIGSFVLRTSIFQSANKREMDVIKDGMTALMLTSRLSFIWGIMPPRGNLSSHDLLSELKVAWTRLFCQASRFWGWVTRQAMYPYEDIFPYGDIFLHNRVREGYHCNRLRNVTYFWNLHVQVNQFGHAEERSPITKLPLPNRDEYSI